MEGKCSPFFQILIVLTDGSTTSGINSLRAPLEQLKKSYVNIFAIGVGNKINRQELELMATDPVRDHVFYVANMQELQTLLQGIGESSCKSKSKIQGEVMCEDSFA